MAQRAVLYEEDPNDPLGKRFIGSAAWRTQSVSYEPGQPSDLAVFVDIEIPERKLTMSWSRLIAQSFMAPCKKGMIGWQ